MHCSVQPQGTLAPKWNRQKMSCGLEEWTHLPWDVNWKGCGKANIKVKNEHTTYTMPALVTQKRL
jgi:hypothetical protein